MEMAAGLPQIISQQPTDLGGGFEDPMDPCTMCQQGQMEIQQAYNDLTQTCNACQTQSNLKQIQSTGCQGCQQAQQVIQNVQSQAGGCSSCGPTQNTMFTEMQRQTMPQQGFLQTGTTGMQMTTASQGLVQPMLTPLTGTGQQMLTTVMPQPGMIAGQLPIAIERGATTQGLVPTSQHFVSGMLTQPMMTTQPMVTGMLTQPMMTTQPMISGMVTAPMQPVVTGMIPAPQPMPMQPVFIPPPMAPAPVMQPVLTPPPPPPVMQPAPTFQVPQLTPAQIAAAQQIAQAATPTFQGGNISIGGLGGAFQGYGAGGGKAGPGSGTSISRGQEGGFIYNFGSGFSVGAGAGGAGVGAAGGFDTHRPDLHKGGGWHMTMPLGTEGIFNLL